MIPLIWTALGLIALLALVYFGLCGLMMLRVLRRTPDDPDLLLRQWEGGPNARYIPQIRQERQWYLALSGEDQFIESYDGLRLHGTLFRREEPRGTILLVHGFHSSGMMDFGCAARFYWEKGFQLLVIDQRAHLQSEGRYLTMGVRERQDVRGWAIFLLERFGQSHRVLLGGMSMGAATVLMAAGLDLPMNVAGVIADCGFTTPRAIFQQVMKTKYRLPGWMLWGAGLWCRLAAGFSIDGASAAQAAARTRLPILLIHGEADDFVPCDMTREIYAAAGDKARLVTVPQAGHGVSYLVEQERVQRELGEFLDRCCPEKG